MATVRAITSRDNPVLARLRKLIADPSAYRKVGQIWVEGEHLCAAYAQRGGAPLTAVIDEAAWQQPTLRTLAQCAADVVVVPEALMRNLSSLESPTRIGFVLAASVVVGLRPGVPSLVLDRLQDGGNVGNLLRSAAAFGFVQVLAMKGTVALWSPKVLRAGMGAHFGLNLVEVLGASDLGALQLPLLGTSSHAALALHDADLPWPCAWLFGHEGQGVDATLADRCSAVVRIEQPGGEESLNVAAAGAICLYESTRQRLVRGTDG
ncbi:MAG: RNA methyltransferase [Burkholderiaceae bacterium]